METNDKKQDDLFTTLILILIALFIAISTCIAYLVALMGARYNTVKFVMFPSLWIWSNAAMALIMIPGSFIIGFMTTPEIGNYLFSHIADFILLTSFFNENSLSYGELLVWHSIAWYCFGRPYMRHISFSVFDCAIQTRCGVETPEYYRDKMLFTDYAYRKHYLFYKKRNKIPLLTWAFSKVWWPKPNPTFYNWNDNYMQFEVNRESAYDEYYHMYVQYNFWIKE